MSTHEQNEPIMDGAGEATEDEKRAGLEQQVAHDHGDDGSDAMKEDLRVRMEQTGIALEEDDGSEDEGADGAVTAS
jgi:hypothetical protein